MNDTANPLLGTWEGPYGLPPFARIKAEHFGPAIEAAMQAHKTELRAISENGTKPDFSNTIEALDRSGALLSRVLGVFFNLCSSKTDEALQAVETEYSPKIAAHRSAYLLDPALFSRIEAVHKERAKAGLDPVQIRLVERMHLNFVMAGARLDEKGRARMGAIVEELARLCTSFGQYVLADEDEWFLELTAAQDLAGLPTFLVDAAAEAAKAKGREGKWAITLSRSFVEPFLSNSSRRDLRKKVYDAFVERGEMKSARDTKPLIKEIMRLRSEQAALHGYKTYAEFALRDRMAGRPEAVAELLGKVWKPAIARAGVEESKLLEIAKGDGLERIEAWDWRYYAEKLRRRDYSLDDAEIKPYFSLDNMIGAMFWSASRLFGVQFREVAGQTLYHPDVRLFEMLGPDGELEGIYLADNFARQGKRSGAWMSNYREQSKGIVPIVVNNTNFTKGRAGEPTLISFDDAKTLFHEFGHGLHGLLSEVDYEGLSGTNVLRDFVELPSQLFEHWALAPEVLSKFALHVETSKPIPEVLVEKVRKARGFNQGWETVQYLGPALLDMELHGLADVAALDPAAFESESSKAIGVPANIGLRHRLPHFQHLFTDDSYAAGYYVYMWAEVLEADVFAAFEEKGDVFDPALAKKLKSLIYSAGNSRDPAELFRDFRGRDPSIEPLLRQRGLSERQ